MEEIHKFAAETANNTGARGSWASRERQARLLMTGVAGRVGLELCGKERPPHLQTVQERQNNHLTFRSLLLASCLLPMDHATLMHSLCTNRRLLSDCR
jgi:hypothetical protein